MTEGTDLIFFMYSCSVHDSFAKVIGQQLGMLLNTKCEKKSWYNHAMERNSGAGFKTWPLKNICIFSLRQFLHMIFFIAPTKNVILIAN